MDDINQLFTNINHILKTTPWEEMKKHFDHSYKVVEIQGDLIRAKEKIVKQFDHLKGIE